MAGRNQVKFEHKNIVFSFSFSSLYLFLFSYTKKKKQKNGWIWGVTLLPLLFEKHDPFCVYKGVYVFI